MKKVLLVVVAVTMLTIGLAACGSKNSNGKNGSTDATTNAGGNAAALSGSLLATGSSALQPLVEQVSTKFMADAKYSGITVQVQGGGSGTGLTQVAGGQAQIGNWISLLKKNSKMLMQHWLKT